MKAAASIVTFFGLVATSVVLFTYHPALVLIPIALIAVALYLFARWERKRFQPPDL